MATNQATSERRLAAMRRLATERAAAGAGRNAVIRALRQRDGRYVSLPPLPLLTLEVLADEAVGRAKLRAAPERVEPAIDPVGTLARVEAERSKRLLALVRKLQREPVGMTYTPDVVRAAVAEGLSRADAQAGLLALDAAGEVELRPISFGEPKADQAVMPTTTDYRTGGRLPLAWARLR